MRRPRRLPRILLNAGRAVSLAICLATVALWSRSYFAADALTFHWRDGRQFRCDSFVGGLMLSVEEGWPFKPKWAWLGLESTPFEETANAKLNFWPSWHPLGFGSWRQRVDYRIGGVEYPGRGSLIGWRVPFWFLSVVTLVHPAWLAVRWIRGRRARRAGRCLACGYNLRATPERCPECGTVPSAR